MSYLPKIEKKSFPKKNQRSNINNRAIRNMVYQSQTWKKISKAYLMQHPLCEQCLSKGKVTSAVDVHHKKSFINYKDDIEKMYEVAFDYGNLMALCRECHNEIHNGKKRKHIPLPPLNQ